MANLLNNSASTLSNQRSLASYKKSVGADAIYIKPLKNKEGEPVLRESGDPIVVFLAVRGKDEVVGQGLISKATVEAGVDTKVAQVGESSYIDKTTGAPKTCMILFNGVDQLEGATLLE